MIWHVHPQTPQKPQVDRITAALEQGEIFILPTDTVYAFVCSLDAPRAINELYKLKRIPEKQSLSLLCRDVAMAGVYAQGIPNHIFRFMKSATPGPYTFILKANRRMDRRGTGKKKEVGIRIVDHSLHHALMERLDVPLVATSITSQAEGEYATDPEDLDRLFGARIAGVIDGGIRYHEYSTVLDCTSGEFALVRQGVGNIDVLGLSPA